MTTFWYIILFSFISGTLSLVGGVVILLRQHWVKNFSIHFISFAAGAMLAGAFLDIAKEALEKGREPNQILMAVLGGIVISFVIERLIYRFHSHEYEDGSPGAAHRHATPILLNIGDGIHNFVDGIVMASAFLVDIRVGIITAIAIGAHELPQEISDFSIMLHHGWRRGKVFWVNFLVSLTNLMGAILTFVIRGAIEPYLPLILGFTAGGFVYIATSDLFPELSPETTRDKTWHILTLLFLGIALIWILSTKLGG